MQGSRKWTLEWCHFGIILVACSMSSALAQRVTAARAGVVHYAEGQLLVDEEVIPTEPNRFHQVRQGQLLCTEDGHAEILLGPDGTVRMGPSSCIRILADDICDVKLQVLRGSAVVNLQGSFRDRTVSLVQSDSVVLIRNRGVYHRIDSPRGGPTQLRVLLGKALVTLGGTEHHLRSGQAFSAGRSSGDVRPLDPKERDSLDEWN